MRAQGHIATLPHTSQLPARTQAHYSSQMYGYPGAQATSCTQPHLHDQLFSPTPHSQTPEASCLRWTGQLRFLLSAPARLVEQVPVVDCGVLAVLAPVDGVDAAGECAQVRLVHLLDLVVGVKVVLARRRVRPIHKAVDGQPVVLRAHQPRSEKKIPRCINRFKRQVSSMDILTTRRSSCTVALELRSTEPMRAAPSP